jgi:hypothetical protein
MKILLIMAVFAALVTGAAAKPSPFAPRRAPPVTEDNALYLQPVGGILKSDYFRRPEPHGTGRIFRCRLRLHAIAHTPRFAQACD